MPCYRPLDAWRTIETLPSGKSKIVFQQSENSTTKIQLPCGICIGCRLERSLVWATRCIHEAQAHTQNSFLTLTYSNEHLPADGSLIKWHFQDFMKRLRKRYSSRTLRYYMCGEYGERFTRPHYHVCLFGLDFPDKEIFKENEGILTYTSETLESIWTHGHCTLGDLNFHTAAYTARYILKKALGQEKETHYYRCCEHTMNLIPIEPEYCSMSLKPGIGEKWYKKYQDEVFPSDFLIHKGNKIKVPRYYETLHEREGNCLEEVKIKRKKEAAKKAKDNTPERLAVREKCKQLTIKQLTRSYEQ